MTSSYFYFDQTTLNLANTYSNAGNDCAMYHTLSDAFKASGSDARLANGLKNAGTSIPGKAPTPSMYVE